MFCRLTIPGRTLRDVVVLQRKSIQTEGEVYLAVLTDGKLTQATSGRNRFSSRRLGNHYCRTFPGDKVITTALPKAMSGMALALRSPAANGRISVKGSESQSGPVGALVRAAVDHPVAINVLMVGLLIVGWDTSNRIQRESFPKIDLDIVSASVVWPGHTPEEVEEAIILKIEEAVHAIEGVDLITADANSSRGDVRIELKSGYDQRVVLDNITTLSLRSRIFRGILNRLLCVF